VNEVLRGEIKISLYENPHLILLLNALFFIYSELINVIISNMNKILAIKPGPKREKEDGTDDKRQRIDPPNKTKHPDLKPHIPKPKK